MLLAKSTLTSTLSMLEKVQKSEKKSMTGHGQRRTCSHPIYIRLLTGICQAVRMFSPYQFHEFVSIETLHTYKFLTAQLAHQQLHTYMCVNGKVK